MLKLRLIKGGKPKAPFYKIGLMDVRTHRNGFVIKFFGFFNPLTKNFKIKLPFLFFYLKRGIQPTKRVKYLLINSKILIV